MNKQKAIEQKLEQALLEGRWKLFERLPSERVLAEEFSVNRTTLRAALSSLAGRGILETIHGSGTRVRALPAACSALKKDGESHPVCWPFPSPFRGDPFANGHSYPYYILQPIV